MMHFNIRINKQEAVWSHWENNELGTYIDFYASGSVKPVKITKESLKDIIEEAYMSDMIDKDYLKKFVTKDMKFGKLLRRHG